MFHVLLLSILCMSVLSSKVSLQQSLSDKNLIDTYLDSAPQNKINEISELMRNLTNQTNEGDLKEHQNLQMTRNFFFPYYWAGADGFNVE